MSALQAEERQLIRDVVDRFILDNYAFENRKKRPEGSEKYGGNWKQFAELGWLALPFAETVGGFGGGVADVQTLMQAFGRGLIMEPYLEVALIAGKTIEFCLPPERSKELLIPILEGEKLVILAHGEHETDPGFDHVKCAAQRVTDGYVLAGVKRVVYQAGAAEQFLVTARLNGKPALFNLASTAGNLQLHEYCTVDDRYAADLQLDEVKVMPEALLASGEGVETGVRKAILFCISALIGEFEGIAESLKLMTAEYLNTREQFGRKIGSFQALQHMFADMVIAEEEIASLAWLTATAWEMEDEAAREKVIRMSKARAGKIARQMAEIGVQLHGGIGVTDEFIVSHYLRRMVALDAMFGDSEQQLIWLAKTY